ncbi:type I secretion system permease/ATPase [Roseiterribacter gracilis]|uniref:Peptidase n=1 Tax=Roseiterribacter gracilis TaxID=2812848 RepID=A0A8S8XF90_9PROT|nr:peptidase [Rhodospirillales bacterium TMPK1]
MNPQQQPKKKTELDEALVKCREAFYPALAVSLFANLLLFIAPLYVMQIVDRVLAIKSVDTLMVLSGLTIVLALLLAFFEFVRARLLVRAGVKFDMLVDAPIFRAVTLMSTRAPGVAGAQALRDLDRVRSFITSSTAFALLDAVWVPVFLALAFAFNAWVGVVGLAGAIAVVAIAITNDMRTKKTFGEANRAALRVDSFVGTSLRNTDALEAMGMLPAMLHRWRAGHVQAVKLQAEIGDRSGTLNAALRFARYATLVLAVAIGTYLSIRNELSSGGVLAAAMVVGFALGPIEAAVAQWPQLLAARAAVERLRALLQAVPAERPVMQLPRPHGVVTLSNVIAGPPGARAAVIKGVNVQFQPGEVVGIIGPSGGGKTSVLRVALGLWPAASGSVRIDGAELGQWDTEALSKYVGYVPQEIELFDGTVAENIARFADPLEAEPIILAARRTGLHEAILALPDGYNTQIGINGAALSGGMRQRLALARAMYGDPVLVILDEPNSSLDAEGENVLVQVVANAKAEGRTVIFTTHRLQLLATADKVLVMNNGMAEAFGPRDEVLARYTRPTVVANNQPVTQQTEDAPPADAAESG